MRQIPKAPVTEDSDNDTRRVRLNLAHGVHLSGAHDTDGKIAVADIPVVFNAHVMLEELRRLRTHRHDLIRSRLGTSPSSEPDGVAPA